MRMTVGVGMSVRSLCLRMAHGGKVLRFGLPGYRSFPLNGANCEPERFVYWLIMMEVQQLV